MSVAEDLAAQPAVPATMQENAQQAAQLLKALSHEGRLMILCHLVEGERSVGELEALLDSRQAAVSQQLARLRQDGLVQARREGKAIYYRLGDERAGRVLALLYDMFCAPGGALPDDGEASGIAQHAGKHAGTGPEA